MALSAKQRAYHRAWYHRTRHKTRSRRRRWRIERDTYYWEKLLSLYGEFCDTCGIVDREVLTIHHHKGNGWADRKRHIAGAALARLIVLGKRKKKDYRLLCMNCNWREGQRKIRKDGRPDLLKRY